MQPLQLTRDVTPNWLTLSMILAGWGIGLLNTFGVAIGPGPIDAAFRGDFPASGGIGASLLGTLVGFGLLCIDPAT